MENGGDDETRTRDLCRDRLGIHVLSATYILAGAAKSLKGTVGTVLNTSITERLRFLSLEKGC